MGEQDNNEPLIAESIRRLYIDVNQLNINEINDIINDFVRNYRSAEWANIDHGLTTHKKKKIAYKIGIFKK